MTLAELVGDWMQSAELSETFREHQALGTRSYSADSADKFYYMMFRRDDVPPTRPPR